MHLWETVCTHKVRLVPGLVVAADNEEVIKGQGGFLAFKEHQTSLPDSVPTESEHRNRALRSLSFKMAPEVNVLSNSHGCQ